MNGLAAAALSAAVVLLASALGGCSFLEDVNEDVISASRDLTAEARINADARRDLALAALCTIDGGPLVRMEQQRPAIADAVRTLQALVCADPALEPIVTLPRLDAELRPPRVGGDP